MSTQKTFRCPNGHQHPLVTDGTGFEKLARAEGIQNWTCEWRGFRVEQLKWVK